MSKEVNFIKSLLRLKKCVNDLANSRIKEDFLVVETMALIGAKEFNFKNNEVLADISKFIDNFGTEHVMTCNEAIKVLKDIESNNVELALDCLKSDTFDSIVDTFLFYNLTFEALSLSIEALRNCRDSHILD